MPLVPNFWKCVGKIACAIVGEDEDQLWPVGDLNQYRTMKQAGTHLNMHRTAATAYNVCHRCDTGTTQNQTGRMIVWLGKAGWLDVPVFKSLEWIAWKSLEGTTNWPGT